MNIYAIKDCKSGNYFGLHPHQTDETDVRELKGVVNMSGSILHQYPADFELYRIASFNERNGEIFADFKFVCNCASLVERGEVNEGV